MDVRLAQWHCHLCIALEGTFAAARHWPKAVDAVFQPVFAYRMLHIVSLARQFRDISFRWENRTTFGKPECSSQRPTIAIIPGYVVFTLGVDPLIKYSEPARYKAVTVQDPEKHRGWTDRPFVICR